MTSLTPLSSVNSLPGWSFGTLYGHKGFLFSEGSRLVFNPNEPQIYTSGSKSGSFKMAAAGEPPAPFSAIKSR